MTKDEQKILNFLKLSTDRADSFVKRDQQKLTKKEREELNQDIKEFKEQYGEYIKLLGEKFNMSDLPDFSTL